MSTEGDGNGNGDGDFLTYGVFNQYRADNEKLCSSYREHLTTKIVGLEDKIDTSEKNISSKVKIVGAVVSIIVGVLTLINIYLSVVM